MPSSPGFAGPQAAGVTWRGRQVRERESADSGPEVCRCCASPRRWACGMRRVALAAPRPPGGPSAVRVGGGRGCNSPALPPGRSPGPGNRETGGLAAFSSHRGCWLLFNIPTHVSVCSVNRSDCESQAAVLSPSCKANILPAYGLKSRLEIGNNKQTNKQTTTTSQSLLSPIAQPHPPPHLGALGQLPRLGKVRPGTAAGWAGEMRRPPHS